MNLDTTIAVARGDEPADLLLKNARLVNVFAGEVHSTHLAVFEGRVVGFGRYPARRVVDLGGRYVAPGLIDAHVHIESSMVQPSEFARAVLPRGTTTVICDPHEIANVLGMAGVRYMLEASAHLPLGVFVMAPSCVPATHLETAGAELTAADIAELLTDDRVIGLAEMMNVPGVLFRVPAVLDRIRAAADRPIDGHAPGLSGFDLNAYLSAGIRSDHECTDVDEAREKLLRGMHIMIREGSTARNLRALLPLVTPETAHMCLFCTDDRNPDTLLTEGHLDDVVRQAIGMGLEPVRAIKMASFNTAAYFDLKDRGALAPGYRADILVLDDLEGMDVVQVYAGGKLVFDQDGYVPVRPEAPVPIAPSVHLGPGGSESLDLSIPAGEGPARVIGVIPDQVATQDLRVEPKMEYGLVVADPEADVLKIAVIERHHGTGNVGLGLVKGVGLSRGAMASTVAHDSHNLVVIGCSDADMRAAIEAIEHMGGGQVVVSDGEVRAACPLPIAGLMSDLPLETVREQVHALTEAARGLGCTLPEPTMTMSFLSLPVIPSLKLTDQGLVDVGRFDFVPLFGD